MEMNGPSTTAGPRPASAKRIGVDGACWQNNRGYGRQIRGLFRALIHLDSENRYTFFMDSAENIETVPEQAEIRILQDCIPTSIAASSDGHRSFRDMWLMSRALSSREFDILLFPTIYSYVPIFSRAKKLVMIHDVIAEQYPGLTLPSRTARLFWKAKTGLGRLQADMIATVSEYSRQAILKRFKISSERIAVVSEAADSIFRILSDPAPTSRLKAIGLIPGSQLIVYVGGFGPHKNLEMLLEVFAALNIRRKLTAAYLIMVGEYKNEVFFSHYEAIKKLIARLGLADRVMFTGYLPDEDLVVLLNLSTVLVLPSLMEGFGLPAIEAAACGCPVIASRNSPLPEILGAGGLYVDPSQPEELQQALHRVLESENLRACMREAGVASSRKLTWDAAAKQMICLIHNL